MKKVTLDSKYFTLVTIQKEHTPEELESGEKGDYSAYVIRADDAQLIRFLESWNPKTYRYEYGSEGWMG